MTFKPSRQELARADALAQYADAMREAREARERALDEAERQYHLAAKNALMVFNAACGAASKLPEGGA